MNFKTVEELVNNLNKDLGNFTETFQYKRKELLTKKRVNNISKLFSYKDDNRDWAINEGGGTEFQFHIFVRNNYLGYGLGFNTQYVPFSNEKTMVEYMQPYAQSFLSLNTLQDNLKKQGFDYIIGTNNDLKKLDLNKYILIGKNIELKKNNDTYELEDDSYIKLQEELKGILYNSYIDVIMNIEKSEKKKIELLEKISLLKYKKQIILQGPPGTGKTREAKELAKLLLQVEDLKNSDQFKLIQFHPSYTYEDFVRGIVAKPNPDGDGIVYVAENKVLADFAERALENYLDSKKDSNKISVEKWINDQFDLFIEKITIEIEQTKIQLTDNVALVDLTENVFLYIGDVWKGHQHRMSFKDIKTAYLDNNITRQDIVKNMNLSGSARQHATYYLEVLQLFRTFVEDKVMPNSSIEIVEKPYVLIIDEINRANLSSVLGELIYALEYRGEAVESMYAVGEDKKLILPPNLYIIGTMNTADRSVGHIDYAIRRRFAFVDVLPKSLENDTDVYFYKEAFNAVCEMFTVDNVISDFKPNDVALGHSYFMVKKEDNMTKEQANEIFKMKLEFEILPLLKEYNKDGIFIKDILEEIENLATNLTI